jgi:hypothetical protein
MDGANFTADALFPYLPPMLNRLRTTGSLEMDAKKT